MNRKEKKCNDGMILKEIKKRERNVLLLKKERNGDQQCKRETSQKKRKREIITLQRERKKERNASREANRWIG